LYWILQIKEELTIIKLKQKLDEAKASTKNCRENDGK
jgi:hypothetical protein